MHHRMGFFAVPGTDLEITPSSPGINHVAWEYESLDDLLSSWERAKAAGIEPSFCVNHLVSFAFYYRDPDGHLVELLCDGYGDHAKSLDAMKNDPAMAANPPGVSVDPVKLLEARRNGTSLEEMHERSYAGEFKPETPAVHDLPEDKRDPNWRASRELE
jgi:catechol-2,3-dioxygenase